MRTPTLVCMSGCCECARYELSAERGKKLNYFGHNKVMTKYVHLWLMDYHVYSHLYST